MKNILLIPKKEKILCKYCLSTTTCCDDIEAETCENMVKEEHKQESFVEKMIPLQLRYNLDNIKKTTLEEAAENYAKDIGNKDGTAQFDFIRGARWQQERMYSEEEVYDLLRQFPNEEELDSWFEQNKKKQL